jgi:bloom syndrome protein
MEARQFLSKLAELEAKQMALIDMRSGAPIRQTELYAALAINTTTRTRNLYAVGSHVLLVRQYTKTSHIQNDSLIPHALAAFDASMVTLLHTQLRPFASVRQPSLVYHSLVAPYLCTPLQYLASKLEPDNPEVALQYKENLFMGNLRPFQGSDLSDAIRLAGRPVIRWDLTAQAWRHCQIGYKNSFKMHFGYVPTEEDWYEETQALQSGHSLSTERRLYGISPDLIDGVDDTFIKPYIDASIEWQTRLRVVPSGVRLPYSQCTMDHFDSLASQNRFDLLPSSPSAIEDRVQILDALQQVLHQTNQMHSLVLNQLSQLEDKVKTLISSSPAQNLRPASPAPPPHSQSDSPPPPLSPLMAPTTPPPPSETPSINPAYATPLPPPQPTTQVVVARKRSAAQLEPSVPPDPTDVRETRRRRIEHDQPAPLHPPNSMAVEMREHLRRVLGDPLAQWSAQGQHQGVKAALDCEQDCIVILRTGVGKSVIAFLPSLVEQGITIIVIPLVALMRDWQRRLEALAIACEVYDPSNPLSAPGHTNVLLVSSDKAARTEFKRHIRQLHLRRPILRVVIDEAHMYFTDAGFRSSAMAVPQALRAVPAQLVLMSATVSPQAEEHLIKSFGLTPKVTVIREPSQRSELKYVVIHGSQSTADLVQRFQSYLQQMKESHPWTSSDQWVVFAPTVQSAENVAKQLGVPCYHANQAQYPKTDADRTRIYADFVACRREGLVATSALAAGTDYAHIRLTCHVESVQDMTLFIQQSSRAGRDGQPAHCLVLPFSRPSMPSQAPFPVLRGADDFQKLLSNPAQPPCVRRGIGQFSDGRGHSCFEFDDEWQVCYACECTSFASAFSLPYKC